MPLLDLQIALVDMIHAPAGTIKKSVATNNLLTNKERHWLEALASTPGYRVTCEVQKWWRKARLQMSAPLTLRLLQRIQLESLLEDYIESVPCNSLFFAPEVIGLRDFIIDNSAPEPGDSRELLIAVINFESALILVNEYQHPETEYGEAGDNPLPECLFNSVTVVVAPGVTRISFPASPDKLLGALILSQPLPEIGNGPYSVLVAPSIDKLWRPAGPVEDEILRCCQSPCHLSALLDRGQDFIAAVESLLNEKLLILHSS